jgi:hypothetical protein
MNKRAILIICMIFLIVIPTCVLVRYDGAYKGKIIDAETKKPIEGVVILGIWYKVHVGPGGGSHTFYEARETVSDRNGNFEIDGLGLVWRLIDSMGVLIFKSGYQYIGYGMWDSFEIDGGLLTKKVEREGGRAIIPLKKLTTEERRKAATFPEYPPSKAPKDKVKLMMAEIYKERKERGIDY